MRVLLIDVNCKQSSTGKIVYDLHLDLNKYGHKAIICYGRGPLVNEPSVYKFSSNSEVCVHALLTRITGLTGCYSYFATRNLIKFMDEFKPDVVHLHELHAYFANISSIINYLKRNRIRTVWTFHCEFMYTGKCGHAYECEKWKSECGKCPQVREYPSSLVFDFTKKMFNEKKELLQDFNNLTIVTPSNWLADRVRQSFLGDKDIQVIHNGIDTKNIFYPRAFEHLKRKHNISDEKVVVAVAPNLMSEQKGGNWVLKLAKRFQGEKVKFILIGVDDLSKRFDDNIIALGRVSNQIELAEYYSLADVFVICSKRENFPTTCLESLSCGTSVVGFDAGGIKETVPNDYGIFVPYGNMVEIEKATRELIQKATNERVIVNSRYGAENYSKSIMIKKYLELY